MIAWLVAAGGLAGIGYMFLGFPVSLWILGRREPPRPIPAAPDGPNQWPGLTVYVPAHNEEASIQGRIDNLLDQGYPLDRLEILVLSDGSSDGTVCAVEAAAQTVPPGPVVRVIHSEISRGKAWAENVAAREAHHPILVSTDAETRFAPGTLMRLGRFFADPTVGVVGGRLVYREGTGGIGEAARAFWSFEDLLLRLEDRVGLVAKVHGPCIAYRRSLWREIEEFEDVDQVVLLLSLQAGFTNRYEPSAIAFEDPTRTWRQELRRRRRMTRKALLSLRHRWSWADAARDPGFTWAVLSHKVARFLLPLFLAAGWGGTAMLVGSRFGTPGVLATLSPLLVGGAAVLLAMRDRDRRPGVRQTLSKVGGMLLGLLGFALGIIDLIRGDRTGRYRPTRQIGEA